MANNSIDKMSYAELVKFQQRLQQAIADKRNEDAARQRNSFERWPRRLVSM